MSYSAPILSSRSLLDRAGLGNPSLTALQSQTDTLVGGFAEQATDWRSLAAMMAGGMAYRAGRIGVLGLGNGSALRAASVGLGLTAEVSTFEFTHRGLSTLGASSHGGVPTNLWSWNGNGGIRQGLLQSFVTFGALKGAGRLAQGENLIAQHLFQDTAMVVGHQVTGALGIAPRPTGTLAEQFLHAEATNLQIGAGMALAGRFAPGLQALERGLDLSLPAAEADPRFEIRLPEDRMAAATSAGSWDETRPFRSLILHMAEGKNGNGDGDGEGGGKREPPRTTLPQVSIGNATVDAARRPTGSFRLSKNYPIRGIEEGARYLQVIGPSRNPNDRITEAIEKALAEKVEPLVVVYEGPLENPSQENELRRLRIDMHRILINRSELEGVGIGVVIPAKKMAYVFRKRGNLIDVREQSLETTPPPPPEREPRTTPPQTAATGGTGVLSAMNSVKLVEAVRLVLRNPEPTVRFTGATLRDEASLEFLKPLLETRYPLPEGKSLTVILEKADRRFVFSWEAGRVQIREENRAVLESSAAPPRAVRPPSSPSLTGATQRSPTRPATPYAITQPQMPAVSPSLPPPRPSPGPSGESMRDHRLDSLVCLTTQQVYRALESILIHPDPAAVQNPVIRLSHGRIGHADLLSYTDLLSEYRLRDRQRITIAWMEKGGGRLVLERQGDRVQADLIGKFGTQEGRFYLLPEGPRASKIGVFDPAAIREYPFQGRKEYEEESDRRLQALVQSAFPNRPADAPPLVHPGEEGGMRRGKLLARVAGEILKTYERSRAPFGEEDLKNLREIHELLERSYTFFDFDVVENFQNQLNSSRLAAYGMALQAMNRSAEAEKASLWVPLEELDSNFEGRSLLPATEHLRYAFLGHAFSETRRSRSPRENMQMLKDPVRMGSLFSQIFQNYLKAMVDNMDRLLKLQPGASLREVLDSPQDRTTEIGRTQEEFWIRAQDLAEYQRLLLGRSNFHRGFLKEAFQKNGILRILYGNYLLRASQGPSKITQELALLPLDSIDRYTGFSSRP